MGSLSTEKSDLSNFFVLLLLLPWDCPHLFGFFLSVSTKPLQNHYSNIVLTHIITSWMIESAISEHVHYMKVTSSFKNFAWAINYNRLKGGGVTDILPPRIRPTTVLFLAIMFPTLPRLSCSLASTPTSLSPEGRHQTPPPSESRIEENIFYVSSWRTSTHNRTKCFIHKTSLSFRWMKNCSNETCILMHGNQRFTYWYHKWQLQKTKTNACPPKYTAWTQPQMQQTDMKMQHLKKQSWEHLVRSGNINPLVKSWLSDLTISTSYYWKLGTRKRQLESPRSFFGFLSRGVSQYPLALGTEAFSIWWVKS